MAYKRQALFEAIREKAFGDITGSFTALGVPLVGEAVIYTLMNDTNADLYFSTDGSTDQLYLPNTSGTVKDIRANDPSDGLFIAAGTQFYVRHSGSAATSGRVVLEIIYAEAGR